MGLVKPLALTTLVLALALLIYRGLAIRWPRQQLDAAGYVDLLRGGGLNTDLIGQFLYAVIAGPVKAMNVPVTAACSLLATDTSWVAPSLWPLHPYVIAIPLGLLSTIGIPALVVGLGAIALSVAGGIVLALGFLVRRGVSLLWVVPFGILLIVWPVMSEGLLGQPYFDRLFFGPGIVLVLAIWMASHRSRLGAIIAPIAVLGSALLTERTALIAGVVALIYPLVLIAPGRRLSRYTAPVMLAGAASLAWFAVWMVVIQDSGSYQAAASTDVLGALARFGDDPHASHLWFFFLVNIPVLILVALAPRGLIVAAAVTLPNLIINPMSDTGLINLVTHYHQTYAPVLGGLAAVGLAQAHRRRRLRSAQSLGRTPVTPMDLLVAGVVIVGLSTWSVAQSDRGGIDLVVREAGNAIGFYSSDAESALNWEGAEQRRVADFVANRLPPHDAIVSAPEAFAPALLMAEVPTYAYLPAGVWDADAVIANYAHGATRPQIFAYSSLPELEAQLGGCVQREITRRFRFAKSFPYSGGETRVYLRNSLPMH